MIFGLHGALHVKLPWLTTKRCLNTMLLSGVIRSESLASVSTRLWKQWSSMSKQRSGKRLSTSTELVLLLIEITESKEFLMLF